jgi:hypothetical protein
MSSDVVSLHYRGNVTKVYLRGMYMVLDLYNILKGCPAISRFYTFYNLAY